MCVFSGGQQQTTQPTVRSAPVRRGDGYVATLFSRRRRQARGVFGNIFTSPLGATQRAQASATRLSAGSFSVAGAS